MCAGYLVGCGWWGGWRVVGGSALVLGFWMGVGSEVGVSGGWRCSAGGGWFLGGGWCGWWGLFPLDPSLTPPPGRLVCCGSWFGPSLCWAVVLFAGGCLAGCSSFLRGWAGLAGGLSCWLCSGRVVLNLGSWLLFSLAVQVRPRGCWGVPWLRALWVASGSGGCSLAGRVVPVGWADLDGRALRHPPFPPLLYATGHLNPPDSVGELTR